MGYELETIIGSSSSGLSGTITGYKEVSTTAATKTALNSTSLERKPASYKGSFVRRKSSYFPFRPGGLGDIILDDELDESGELDQATRGLEKAFEKGRGGIRTIPPGFARGLDFGPQSDAPQDGALLEEEVQEVEIQPIYRPMLDLKSDGRIKNENGSSGRQAPKLDSSIEELLPTRKLVKAPTSTTAISRRRPVVAKKDWAHVVDVNREIVNFRETVPDMAREYPFELNTFQKEAIYHMEVGDSVFVAAHTSAGKTVVAEYAIALAQKHLTRATYTSPIKVLSNKKFRDFQKTYKPKEVGILTGDVQIDPFLFCSPSFAVSIRLTAHYTLLKEVRSACRNRNESKAVSHLRFDQAEVLLKVTISFQLFFDAPILPKALSTSSTLAILQDTSASFVIRLLDLFQSSTNRSFLDCSHSKLFLSSSSTTQSSLSISKRSQSSPRHVTPQLDLRIRIRKGQGGKSGNASFFGREEFEAGGRV